MLGKMLVHGLAAAIVIGSAAAVYAQAKDNGYLSTPPPPASFDTVPAVTSDDGDIRWSAKDVRRDKHDRKRHDKADRRRDRDHDDDDDD